MHNPYREELNDEWVDPGKSFFKLNDVLLTVFLTKKSWKQNPVISIKKPSVKHHLNWRKGYLLIQLNEVFTITVVHLNIEQLDNIRADPTISAPIFLVYSVTNQNVLWLLHEPSAVFYLKILSWCIVKFPHLNNEFVTKPWSVLQITSKQTWALNRSKLYEMIREE